VKIGPTGHGYLLHRDGEKLCPECEQPFHSYRYFPGHLDVFKSVQFNVCGQVLTKELWLLGYEKDPCTYLRYLQSAKDEHEGQDFQSSDDSCCDTADSEPTLDSIAAGKAHNMKSED
jgi:hypothetical protein